jgi:putative redox protein
MTAITARYDGNLRCTLTHGPSGTVIETDAPTDNHGKGERFSPTDLVAAALPACIMTILGIVAERHGLDLRGMSASVRKEMSAGAPRRISRLPVRLEVPLPPDHPQRPMLENAAHTCPVHKSLGAEVESPIEFVWTG